MQGTCVLVVDDDDQILEFTCAILRRAGYTVYAAASAQQGVEYARSLGSSLDLVISDLTMQQMSGVELVSTLQAENELLQALVVSGTRSEALEEVVEQSPRLHFLPKPFMPRDLLDNIQYILKDQTTCKCRN